MTGESIKTKLLATTLLAGLTGAAFGGVAIAQEDEESVQEQVVITGSRLRRAPDETIAVTTIGSEQIERRGFTNVIDAIQELPAASLGTNLEGATLANNDFTANANLLNLGTNRTLTLVNGRRFVSSNQATVFVPGNSNGAQVDLTLINPALIRSVDAVVGSAGGATYGADAVGGVINLELIDDYEGFEVDGQFGITDQGDGQTFRIGVVGGKNFLNDRANVTVALEYNDINQVTTTSGNRLQASGFVSGQGFASLQNQFATPDDATGIPTTVLTPGVSNPLNNINGLLVAGPQAGSSVLTQFFPNDPDNIPAGFAALSNNATPFAFAQTAAGQAIDPLLFVGTFAPSGTFLTVPNTDPLTAAALPNRAVPLQFDSSGNLVPVDLGNIAPPNLGQTNATIGGDGIPTGSIDSIRGAQERFSANILTRFDITNNITYKAEYFYANIENTNIDGFLSNVPNGSATAGTRSIPVFVDDNPFLNQAARDTIAGLEAQGLTLPEIDGRRALFLSRALLDVTGPTDESAVSDFYRTAQEISGEFNTLGRDLYWSGALSYGRVDRVNNQDTLLDVEFAIATDVVADVNGNPVCRQQTLPQGEPIATQNPQLAFINTGLAQPTTPTPEQIAACQPLNLFGNGAPSQAAIDFVSTSNQSSNTSEQFLVNAEFGGDLIELPGGTAIFNTQFEYRKEQNLFTPGTTFAFGLGRNTLGQPSDGELNFLEGGAEVSIPILGEGFNFLGGRRLEFDGAVRVVSREGSSTLLQSDRVTDVVYNVGGRYSPVDWLTVRGSQSTTIRSPSIVELFGAGVTGFSGARRGNSNVCDEDSINGGPDPALRLANCQAAVAALGLPADFLDGFQAEPGAAPAAGASNPLLENEESDTWTVGVVIQPEWLIPGLTIQADWYNLDLDNEIQLTSISGNCFDDPAFPNTIVNGLNACSAFTFGVEDPANPGQFIVPTVNPLTGATILPVANPGSPAQTNAPFNSTFAFFDTVNLAARRLEALNTQVNYQFALEDMIGGRAANWGDLSLTGSLYYLHNYDTFFSAAAVENGLNNPRDGEHGDPEFVSRLDITHTIGKLNHNIQWIRTSGTVTDVNEMDLDEQNAGFVRPSFNLVNYNAVYNVTDDVSLRFVVNNLADAKLDTEAGLASALGQGDALGRRFIFGVNAKF